MTGLLRLWLAMTIFGITSCSIKFAQVVNVDDTKRFLDRIVSYNSNIKQVKGLIEIKGSGLLKSFFHEQVDVLAQNPDWFLLSVRSFFNTPQALIAFDGDNITSLDFAGISKNFYQKIPATKQYFNVGDFGLFIEPMESILQAKIPLLAATSLNFYVHESLLKVEGKTKGLLDFFALFDLSTNELKKIKYESKENKASIEVDFSQHTNISGISFPLRHVVRMKNKKQRITLDMFFSNVILNDDKKTKTVFFLEP